jgi:hypothetical protein
MSDIFMNIGWAVIFSLVGGVIGIVLILIATMLLPRLIDKFTPNIDENKEIARGNQAVAEYFGRITAASIIGISIIIAAAILSGVIAGLY